MAKKDKENGPQSGKSLGHWVDDELPPGVAHMSETAKEHIKHWQYDELPPYIPGEDYSAGGLGRSRAGLLHSAIIH